MAVYIFGTPKEFEVFNQRIRDERKRKRLRVTKALKSLVVNKQVTSTQRITF